MSSFDGIVLLGHGARDARWAQPFVAMVAELRRRVVAKVELAFLDFVPPTFGEAVAELYRAGARDILVVPMFQSSGGHVAKDVPVLVDAERRRYDDMNMTVAGAIGEEPEVVEAYWSAIVRLAGSGDPSGGRST